MLVAKPVLHGGPKILGECMPAVDIERLESSDGAEGGILNEITRISGGSGPLREAPVSPASQVGKIATEETPKRARVTSSGAKEQAPGCFLRADPASRRGHVRRHRRVQAADALSEWEGTI